MKPLGGLLTWALGQKSCKMSFVTPLIGDDHAGTVCPYEGDTVRHGGGFRQIKL